MPEHLQEQANEILKSTYNIEMLGLRLPLRERELVELRLVEKIKIFQLELGTGFTYIGNQHRLSHNDKDHLNICYNFLRKRLNILL